MLTGPDATLRGVAIWIFTPCKEKVVCVGIDDLLTFLACHARCSLCFLLSQCLFELGFLCIIARITSSNIRMYIYPIPVVRYLYCLTVAI